MKILVFFLASISCLFGEMYVPKNYTHLLKMEGFSDSLLEIHFKLYQGYVKNVNELVSKMDSLSQIGQINSVEYGALKRRFGWEFNGMRLHELYFENMGGDGKLDSKSPLSYALQKQFGNFVSWKKEFVATGMMRGIGWSILYLDPESGRLFNTWINEHDVGHLADGKVILIMDVFEHAYMPQYGLDKAKYIEAFFNNIDWERVSRRYREAH